MRTVKQPRAFATRDKILGEAARLFALKGYHDAKLEEVQTAAGVTTGAFFHHFGGKEELGFAVIDRHMETRGRALERIEKSMPPVADGDPLRSVFRRLDAIETMIGRRRGKGGCVIGNLSTALSDSHEGFRRRLAECFDEMAGEFQPFLQAALKRRGAVRRGEAKALARYVVAVVEGSIMMARAQRDGGATARNFANLKEFLKQRLGT